MKVTFSSILKIIYDHYILFIGSIIGIVVTTLWRVFGSDKVLGFVVILKNFLLNPYVAWCVVLIIILITIITRIFSKKHSASIYFATYPPQYKIAEGKPIELFAVTWKPWLGHNNIGDTEKDAEVWANGPYCPRCDYELDVNYKADKWICVNCNKKYSIPKEIQDDPREKVIKILEASRRKTKIT